MIHVACCIKQSHVGCFVVGVFFRSSISEGLLYMYVAIFIFLSLSLKTTQALVKAANEPSNHKSDDTVVVSDRWTLNTGRK